MLATGLGDLIVDVVVRGDRHRDPRGLGRKALEVRETLSASRRLQSRLADNPRVVSGCAVALEAADLQLDALDFVVKGAVPKEVSGHSPVVERAGGFHHVVEHRGRSMEDAAEPARQGLGRVFDRDDGGCIDGEDMGGVMGSVHRGKAGDAPALQLLDPFDGARESVADRDCELGKVDILDVPVRRTVEGALVLHDLFPQAVDLIVEASLRDAARILAQFDGLEQPLADLAEQEGVDVVVRLKRVGCGTGGERRRGLPQLVIPLDPVEIELRGFAFVVVVVEADLLEVLRLVA